MVAAHRAHGRLVDLQHGAIIYRADQRIDHVYFPETAVVAMIDTVEGGATVEVGSIGHEGMVGINISLGCLVTPDKAIVQISGSAMRMKTNDLRKELRFGSPLQRLLLHYTQALLAIISQSVGKLQAGGLISYRRAHIQILDETKLKKKSCECYRFIRQQFDGMLREVPRLLSGRPRASGRR